jgi:hypothetical protein
MNPTIALLTPPAGAGGPTNTASAPAESPLLAAISRLKPGATLEGAIIGRDPVSRPLLRTAHGILAITSRLDLKTGSDVVLRMSQLSGQLRAEIVSVDGRPVEPEAPPGEKTPLRPQAPLADARSLPVAGRPLPPSSLPPPVGEPGGAARVERPLGPSTGPPPDVAPSASRAGEAGSQALAREGTDRPPAAAPREAQPGSSANPARPATSAPGPSSPGGERAAAMHRPADGAERNPSPPDGSPSRSARGADPMRPVTNGEPTTSRNAARTAPEPQARERPQPRPTGEPTERRAAAPARAAPARAAPSAEGNPQRVASPASHAARRRTRAPWARDNPRPPRALPRGRRRSEGSEPQPP